MLLYLMKEVSSLNKFCNNKCAHLNKIKQHCTKFKQPLPCNLNLKVFRCEECLEEDRKNENKNQTRDNK